MPTLQRNTFKLGLTVLLMIVLAFACMLFISGQDLFKPVQSPLRVHFPAYAGMPLLSEGAFVHYLGQRVGTVQRLGFADGPLGEHYLEVTASVRADLGLRRDCQVTLAGPVLGGGGVVEIVNRGQAAEPPLDSGAPLPGTVTSFQSIVEKISLEMDEAYPDGVLAKLKRQIDPLNADGIVYRINHSLEHVQGITARAREEMDRDHADTLLGKIHGGLSTVNAILDENREPLREGVAHGSSALASGETFMKSLAREFEMEHTPAASLLAKLHDNLDCLNDAMTGMSATVGDVRETVALNKDSLTEVFTNASEASLYLKQLTLSVLLNPRWLLTDPSSIDKRERVLFGVARTYAEAASRLDLTTARLKSLLESRDARIPIDDPTLIQIRENLTVAWERFTAAEHALLEEFQIPPPKGP